MSARPEAGISRREMLKRGTVVGGAAVTAWAAPSVTTFGARAFAAEGTEVPSPSGDVSWVMVWFRVGNTYHLVKYEGGSSGYSQQCDATRNNVSRDGDEGFLYFDAQQHKARKFTRNTACPDGVSVSSVDGRLQLTLAANVEILGWVLHDGSCQKPPGGGGPQFSRFRSVEFPYAVMGDSSSGTVGPVGKDLKKGGAFEWRKCR
jgi:hypothetical protein